MTNVGLVVKSVKLNVRERKNEIYLRVFAASRAVGVADGAPLVHQSETHVVEGIRRRKEHAFPGEGFLVLPPTPVFGELLVWHIELWESDSDFRDRANSFDLADGRMSIRGRSLLGQALQATSLGAATVLLKGLSIAAEAGLKQAGRDDLLLTWTGSLFTDQVDTFKDAEIPVRDEKAEVLFGVIVTEG